MPLDQLAHAPNDFDFIIGDWMVKHERLRERLVGSDEWDRFDGFSSTVKTLGGFGNLEDHLLMYLPAKPALSHFEPSTRIRTNGVFGGLTAAPHPRSMSRSRGRSKTVSETSAPQTHSTIMDLIGRWRCSVIAGWRGESRNCLASPRSTRLPN